MSPTIGDAAHIRGVADHTSPIEDQAVAVYNAARRLAQTNGFKPHTHKGPMGTVEGVAGPMVLSRLVRQLFPAYNEDEFKTVYSIINQALRKTDSMVCLRRPAGDPQHRDPKDLPIWFIRDKMPGNLVVVTLAQAKKSADVTQQPSHFDEEKYLTKRERRLPAETVGEDLPPGEVTVTQTRSNEERVAPLKSHHEKLRAERQRLRDRVIEEIQTSPVPMTTAELTVLVNQSEGWAYHKSTYRDLVRSLTDGGVLVQRAETPEEALVRGGGAPPKATRPKLLWPAPGPVPVRTELPAGTEPAKPAQYWDDVKREQREADMAAVLDYIKNHTRDQRRRTHLINALGITDERLDTALRHLTQDGSIYVNQGRYYLTRDSGKVPATESDKSLPTENNTVTVQTTPSPIAVTDGDQGNLELVLNLAAKLGVQLPKGDEAKTRELETTVRGLTDQVADLVSENTRLREQVKALKAAIATLD